jgi:hypothetical protein
MMTFAQAQKYFDTIADLTNDCSLDSSKKPSVITGASSSTLHDLNFFRRQPIEFINQLVYLPLQRAYVCLRIPRLHHENAINQALNLLLLFGRGCWNWNLLDVLPNEAYEPASDCVADLPEKPKGQL